MPSNITREYLRGRLAIVLIGVTLAVMAGGGFILFKAQQEKTKVKFGTVIGHLAEVTNDLLTRAARLESAALNLGENRITESQISAYAHPEVLENIRQRIALREVEIYQGKNELNRVLGRLIKIYRALEWSVDGDIRMNESQRITLGESVALPDRGLQITEVTQPIAGLPMPDAVQAVWNGQGEADALKNDLREVISQAERLDMYSEYSNAAARRIFADLRNLAESKVRPGLERALNRLHDDMIASYGGLQYIMVLASLSIVGVSLLVGSFVFRPMVQNITEAHNALKSANDHVEAARKRAEDADRAKSEFLANMSHEIRTPMNGVLGMAELLGKTSLDNRQQTFADVIVKSGNALLTIINDILDFSRIDAGQLALNPAPFRIAEAIEDVATLVSARAAEKDIELIVRVDPRLPQTVDGDVGRIRQIATNLVGNAVKFTERGHVLVDVSGQVIGETCHVKFTIEDTGIGIPPDRLGQVFEKFSQVDATSTRRHEGTGLGLAIASRLISLMGGEIGVDSKLGKGSVFWFTLPLKTSNSAVPTPPLPLDVSGARVLVIDDNSINREILTEQLHSWNFDCAATENGPMGLVFLEKAEELGAPVDCIIVDFQMPEMNGEEVVRALRSTPAIASVPVVLLTSVDQSDSGRLFVELGVNACLTKPARSSLLLETLVEVLQKSKSVTAGLAQSARALPARAEATSQVLPMAKENDAKRRFAGRADGDQETLDVLVAEDNEVNQLVFSQILDGMGVNYHIVDNGKKAVEAWQRRKPNVILMDVSMPEMNGLEATRQIRQAEGMGDGGTPIIGVTAHALTGDRERCLDAGMNDYLSKPVSPDKLSEKMGNWLEVSGADANVA